MFGYRLTTFQCFAVAAFIVYGGAFLIDAACNGCLR
jgi:hypothetical protein